MDVLSLEGQACAFSEKQRVSGEKCPCYPLVGKSARMKHSRPLDLV